MTLIQNEEDRHKTKEEMPGFHPFLSGYMGTGEVSVYFSQCHVNTKCSSCHNRNLKYFILQSNMSTHDPFHRLRCPPNNMSQCVKTFHEIFVIEQQQVLSQGIRNFDRNTE